jgi:hypothetical protein
LSSFWEAARHHVTDTAIAQKVTEALLRARNRRLLTRFEQIDPGRAQLRVLLGLLNQARNTKFGIDHDFRRIRSAADYRRLVPLTMRTDLWRDYWEPALPNLGGATWPVLPSAALLAANVAALRTLLALAAHARPHLRLLTGRVVWLGEDIAWSPDPAHPTPRARDVFGRDSLPWEMRPYTSPAHDSRKPVSCVAGSIDRLLKWFEHTSLNRPPVVFYSRRVTDPDVGVLRAAVGDDVLLLEIGVLREGILAVEDPRYGQLRLLPEHGMYFEFIPATEAQQLTPTRLGLDEIETGVSYELALTSVAGVWACRAGLSVQFDRRDPLLVRFLQTSVVPQTPPVTRPSEQPANVTAQLPHRRSDGIPVARPESFVHTPWLIRADRG